MSILKGKRVLITRDATQAGSLKSKLELHSATVVNIPTIRITDPPDWQPFDTAAGLKDQFDWIIFSSVNAVTQTKTRLTQLGLDLSKTKHVKIAAVGDQTAAEIEFSGWKTDLKRINSRRNGYLSCY